MKYLSIDLDFFNYNFSGLPFSMHEKAVTIYLFRLFTLAKSQGIKVQAVMNHQQLLPLVSNSPARTLVNLDTHSDLGSHTVDTLDCGTWVSFIPWRKQGTYLWLHKSPTLEFNCSGRFIIFDDFNSNGYPKHTDWKTAKHKKLLINPSINYLLKDCIEIGLVLSPGFTFINHNIFYDLIKKFNIPYKKGRRNEDFYIYRNP